MARISKGAHQRAMMAGVILGHTYATGFRRARALFDRIYAAHNAENSVAAMLALPPYKSRSANHRSKFARQNFHTSHNQPHQNKRECARRQRQMLLEESNAQRVMTLFATAPYSHANSYSR